MFSASELCLLGLPGHLVPLALELLPGGKAEGLDANELRERLLLLVREPQALLADTLLGPLARAALRSAPQAEAAPWRQWGNAPLEEEAGRQMKNACLLPVAVRGALMPDAHTGYGLPIGGVLAARNAVIPYAVGVDIACRMRLSVLDMPLSSLLTRREKLIQTLERETRFGLGAAFSGGERREHPVMDRDWTVSPATARSRDKAWSQLGSSGGGNHFVEWGELHLESPALGLEPGAYLALLSHSGSRGAGEKTADHYSKRAMELCPDLPEELRHLAWLELDGADGREYWEAMLLMGHYAAANHELIHRHVLRAVGAAAVAEVENHHNFAWIEEYDGHKLVVHRKGATPAGKGVLGIVPGSMGSPGFVVRGKGNAASLNSCSHGAGRVMSRAAALKTFCREQVLAQLEDAGVQLLSGGLDEAPGAYKDIHVVMNAQADLVEILARFEPRLVKMAPEEKFRKALTKK